MKRILALLLIFCLTIISSSFNFVFADNDSNQIEIVRTVSEILAFPGAEGGGKYTKGARGALDEGGSIEVYHVTNLNSDGSGSFTEAISADPIELDADGNPIAKAPVGRIVVFDVGGVINFPAGHKINRDYITILGQTAPGDGVTITGGDLQIGNARKNVIIRYLRVRPTNSSGTEVDGMGGQWNQDVIIDHCSTSWCVDECLTLYGGNVENTSGYAQGNRLTVQNTISAESMRMSGHFKGAHGYGAIIGGTNATYYRNLFAHHDSRSPRLDRVLLNTDFRNNIVYNWGVTNSAYGAEPVSPHPGNARGMVRPSLVNYSNNYYSFGPSTVAGKRYRIFDFKDLAKEVGKTYNNIIVEKSKFYMTDNYVDGSPTVTSNNWSGDGVNNAADQVEKIDTPFLLGDNLYSNLNIPEDKLLAGKDVKDSVLSDVGATLPKRDSIDARVIADVKNRTGRIINNEEEVGGFAGIQSSERVWEIPDVWKTANGMDGYSDTDIVMTGEWEGYTWIEAYVNDWTDQQSVNPPTNPEITVTSPAIASVNSTVNGQKVNNGNWNVIKETDLLSYKAFASAVGNTEITRMELYDYDALIKTYDGAESIDEMLNLTLGTHYLSCMAYNDKGESTRSTTSIVYVNGTAAPQGWILKQIGTNAFSGKGAVSVDDNGLYTMGGSGKIGSKADKCDFMYKEVTGNFDISLKIDTVPANENGPAFGLMVRETLDTGSRMAALVDGWIKFGRNDRIVARTTKNSDILKDENQTNSTDNKIGIFMSGRDGEIVSGNVLGESKYDTLEDGTYHLPNYLRIQRSGDMLIFSVSDSGEDWTDNARQPYVMEISNLADKLYVGVAIDSQEGQSDASPKAYYSQAQFSELNLEYNANYEPIPTVTPVPTLDPTANTKYSMWKPGNATAGGNDAEIEIVNYQGKDSVYIKNRNAYTVLNSPVSSGIVSFNFDIYIDKSVKRNFRVYLENTESNYTVSDNIFAELINNDGPDKNGNMVNYGPELSTNSGVPVLFTYDKLSESGWINFKATLDYSKAETDEFITLTAASADGTQLSSVKMGSIAGVNNSLRAIRLVQTGAPAYFADMDISTILVNDNIYYVDAPTINGDTVLATIKNTADENGALFIAAAYENGIMADAKTVFVPKSDADISVSLNFDRVYSDVRCYLWSNGTIEPYSNVVTVR